MLSFATGLFIGIIAGIVISSAYFWLFVQKPYINTIKDLISSYYSREDLLRKRIDTKDKIIKRQELFISWAKKELSRNIYVKKLIEKGKYLYNN